MSGERGIYCKLGTVNKNLIESLRSHALVLAKSGVIGRWEWLVDVQAPQMLT